MLGAQLLCRHCYLRLIGHDSLSCIRRKAFKLYAVVVLHRTWTKLSTLTQIYVLLLCYFMLYYELPKL